jgi:hypothetical protein
VRSENFSSSVFAFAHHPGTGGDPVVVFLLTASLLLLLVIPAQVETHGLCSIGFALLLLEQDQRLSSATRPSSFLLERSTAPQERREQRSWPEGRSAWMRGVKETNQRKDLGAVVDKRGFMLIEWA